MSAPLSRGGRFAVLSAAFGGLLFDGFELGLMPLASLSVSKDLLGAGYTSTLGGDWFARYTAALMLGALAMHLKVKDPLLKSVPALAMLAMTTTLAVMKLG